uniref:uncharacterized protein LOC124073965 n=1 Tax=Scatophagus argus TaxID=75038 RepID=UPI001ED82B96|nr:uncharacterized protein LOC124073965 [Scatophagus argus]
METRDLKPSPPGLVSQDEGGLWMKTDSDPVTGPRDSPSVSCDEKPLDETKVTIPALALMNRYYSVMDDEDDSFTPPPPPTYKAPFLPGEGSTDAMVNNPSMTLANWAADATEAKANPRGLDWHHGEKQLMAAHNKVDEVKTTAAHTSKAFVDIVALSKDEDSSLSNDQDQTLMEDADRLVKTYNDPPGRHHPDNTTGDEESNVEPEDVVILSGGQKNWRDTKVEGDNYPTQEPSSFERKSANETFFDKEGDKTAPGDICDLAETDPKRTAENAGCDGVEKNTTFLSSLSVNDYNFETGGSPELCQRNENSTEAATNQPQVRDIQTEVSNDDKENVDTRSMDYKLTKYDWVRRESGTSETQVSQLPISEHSDKTVNKGMQGDGNRSIATDIQQGEQLLQRLQQVQLRQDVHTPENPLTSQQVVQEMRGERRGLLGTEEENLKTKEGNLSGGDEKEESRSHAVDDEEGKMILNEKEKTEMKSKDTETKARISSSAMPVEPEHYMIAREEAGDDDQSDSWVPADLSPIDPHETSSSQIPFPCTHHRFSAAETVIERQIHETAQEKQNLQRAGGLFNLADNPDVLEIPFKTNISLEPLATTVAHPCQHSDWQFSEHKMQKEISQEIQRELVLVNQGKIPGGYSKGEVRQLKETKLLFEAFQQDNTEGPTRHRKSPTSLRKGHIYPSVLERTRSLEMFSLKSRPISRAHSLRMYKSTSEMEKSPQDIRSKSPIASSRDKTRLLPNTKQDKHVCLHRSMDSISTDTSVMETGKKSRQGNKTQESPILKHNPFYKLRPSLALQPEVEKDIREAKEREEELRRQRWTLYGENRQNSDDGEKSAPALEPDVRRQSRGKLERVWPPPSKKDQMKSGHTQEPKVHRAGGQKAPLFQRWESGLVNGQPSKEEN